jgi:hypothetical protein
MAHPRVSGILGDESASASVILPARAEPLKTAEVIEMRLLQTRDVALRLGVVTSTIRRWAAEGRLPYQWAGSYRIFDPGDVQQLARKLGERATASGVPHVKVSGCRQCEARGVEGSRRRRGERGAGRHRQKACPAEDVGGGERPEARRELTTV